MAYFEHCKPDGCFTPTDGTTYCSIHTVDCAPSNPNLENFADPVNTVLKKGLGWDDDVGTWYNLGHTFVDCHDADTNGRFYLLAFLQCRGYGGGTDILGTDYNNKPEPNPLNTHRTLPTDNRDSTFSKIGIYGYGRHQVSLRDEMFWEGTAWIQHAIHLEFIAGFDSVGTLEEAESKCPPGTAYNPQTGTCKPLPGYEWDSEGGFDGEGGYVKIDPGIPIIPPVPPGILPPIGDPDNEPGDSVDCIVSGECEIPESVTGYCTILTEECIYPGEERKNNV